MYENEITQNINAEISTAESDNQSETQQEQEIEETLGTTMEEVGGIDQLYDLYLKKEKVQLPPWLVETKKGIEISTQELFIHIKNTQPIISIKRSNSKGIALYIYKNGKYVPWSESDCKAFIKSFLPRKLRKPSDWERVYKEIITEFANTEESELNTDQDIINFENGILNIKTGKLLPHSPEYKTTIQIPCRYLPNLPLAKAPNFQKFLVSLTGGNADDMCSVLDIMSLTISNVPGYKSKKMVILKGKGNTGKTVLREVVTSLIGEENTFTIDISQLNSRFGAAGICNKRLVGSGDMKFARISEMDKIKELTGGDNINVEAKFENSYTMQYNGVLWFNCNELPMFSGDTGEHVFERFLILSCDNVIPPDQRDPQLKEKILAEKEVIVSVLVEFLKQLIARNYKITESERTKKNREEYSMRNNSLAFFINKCCEIGTGRTYTSEFRTKYIEWCKDNGLTQEKVHDINKILINDFNVVKGKSNKEYYELKIKED